MRAMETFPKEEGMMDESLQTFLNSIIEGHDDFDAPTLQNSINFGRTYFELGNKLPQTVINKILRCAFRFPTLVPQLVLYSRYYKSNNWIFNALIKSLSSDFSLVQDSLAKSEPIWSFLIPKFEEDFKSKISNLDKDFYDYPTAFLFESVIFGWDYIKAAHVSFEDLVVEFVNFCNLNPNSNACRSMLNLICSIMPKLVIGKASNVADWISVPNLRLILQQGLYQKGELPGNQVSLAVKMIPIDIDLAKEIIEQCDKDSKEAFNALLTHYNPDQGTFGPNYDEN
ncbi:hypothetical protein TVAG_255870 [Trichomonas vaginalis G3]|uniref:Uncharacterized protein n=1 Tax=Trichomonas vaginalis (strain ATCC PRA-98 / G3) TaxID=412133 RepID=A2DYY4_TRIV3|nr:hypothetical protein TVAGG3_0869220 [Trichomonas vaginalis G3]EAY14395.1 hypothetical protein TVAG_255870 [Trichomonas vaginalis G3]KAI5501246.1 hypothetical protein TVAGG3_0869220 [Trichomonas vaginalis G3]|eukprot:XP_001326618.1 hypothetical protein [Trichomonas vaginalis G3]